LRFELNLESHPYEEVAFFGRLSTSKYWNNWSTQNTSESGFNRLQAGHLYSDESLLLERAYLNYTFVRSVTATVGRLPTAGGAPTNYLDNRKSQEIFPKLTFSGELDGASLKWDAGSLLPSNHSLSLRVLYAPFLLINYNYVGTPITVRPTINQGSAQVETLSPLGTLQANFGSNLLPNSGKTFFVAQYLWLNYLPITDAPAGTVREKAIRSDLKFFHKVSTLHLESQDILSSNLDLSVTYALSQIASDGTVYEVEADDSLTPLGGLGTDLAKEVFDGGTLLVSAKYRTPFRWLGRPFLGAEYIESSKYAFFFDGAAEDPSNFYMTKGWGTHLYLLAPLKEDLLLRVGYRHQSFRWSPIGFGKVVKATDMVDTIYGNIRLDF
jgi:hypothetical protein